MFLTIISAVTVFIISQFVLELVLKPLIRYKEAVYMIDAQLKFYANKLSAPRLPEEKEQFLKIVDIIRKLSCELEASYKQISCQRIFIFLNLIPEWRKIGDAASKLIRISNSVGLRSSPPGNYDDSKEIRRLLNIEQLSD